MLMYESGDGQYTHTQVTAHGEQLQQIVGENNDLCLTFLNLPVWSQLATI